MEFERRFAGLELRAQGRRLSGIALPFNEVSPSHREKFLPGSIRFAEVVHLDLDHDAEKAIAFAPGGGLQLRQDRDALHLTADVLPIPASDRALEQVRSGSRGLSVEFRSLEETRDDAGIRVIEQAMLSGVGLVRSPSYPSATVEARAKSGRTLSAFVPINQDLVCECIATRGTGSGAACRGAVRMQTEVMEPMARMVAKAFEDAQKGIQGRDVLAVHKDFGNPIASARKGTLRASPGAAGLEVEMDLPAGAVGDAVVSANEAAGTIVRPLVDWERSEFVDGADEGRVVTKAHVRAFLVGSTDARGGWPDAVIDHGNDENRAAPRRRRARLWL